VVARATPVRPRPVELAPRELAGLRLILVMAQDISNRIAGCRKQHPALRDGEEAEPTKISGIAINTGDREERAGLIVRQYAPRQTLAGRRTRPRPTLCHLPDFTLERNLLQSSRVRRHRAATGSVALQQRNTLTRTPNTGYGNKAGMISARFTVVAAITAHSRPCRTGGPGAGSGSRRAAD
jgi:hypothetical protein